MNTSVTTETVLNMLRQLPPRDRLKVIAQALPEAERELPAEYPQGEEPRRLQSTSGRKSLRGLWKDLDFDLSAEDIDQARQEAWANFPREDI